MSSYEPNETPIPPFPALNGLGAVHHVRLTTSDGAVHEADEVVTAYVPGRLLSHRVVGASRPNEGTYEFEPLEGGTRITYMFRGGRGISQLIIGEAFDRASVQRRLVAIQRERAARLKQLLEGEAGASV